MADPLSPEHFLPHVGKTFRLQGGSHALTLASVDQRRLQEWETGIAQRAPFNLIFRGPPGNLLAEGLYKFDVEDGPSFELYVMPIQTHAGDRQDYQSAFN
jgi:hypothetical protein